MAADDEDLDDNLTASSPSPLAGCGLQLTAAADRMVSAAAVLGESQQQEENPTALSACGGALAKAGAELRAAARSLSEDGDWECTAEALLSVATSLKTASAALEASGDAGSVEFAVMAAELEDASTVTGCIALAAAAGPNLIAAGEALADAASAIRGRGVDLANGASAAHVTAGEELSAAAGFMEASAAQLCTGGEQLEAGTAGPV